MGYSTDFIGHVDVTPVLNEQERAYLRAFSDSRRCSRPGGPYEVPGNPAAEYDDPTLGPPQTNELADDQPGYWCDWVPCLTGCCLAYNGHEKFYQATRWMQYLIDHFLKPDAFASRSTLSWFKEFTFDHRADGVVAGCRRDNKELFLIVVENNAVRREVLTPADRRFVDEAPLAYESYLDAIEAERPSRRSRLRSVQ